MILIFKVENSFSQDSSSEIIQDTVALNLKIRSNTDTNYFNIFSKSYSDKKTALVLSGGGARGIAQLGIIEELEKNNIRIDMIVGTSMGSIIGGFYASGYNTGEIKNLLLNLNWKKALSLTNKYQRTSLFLEQKKIQDRSLLTIPLDGIKPVLLPSSFSNGQYLSEKINSYILNSRYHAKNDFTNLKIPFSAVATDLNSGKRVILDKGNLSESIKASFTFPLLYSPININGRELVDGGLTENIPTGVAKTLGADFIVAVNSTSPLKDNNELKDPINTADQILSISMTQLNKLQLKDANIVLTPDIKNFSATDFTNIDYLISEGKKSAREMMDKIISGIDSLEMSESRYFNNFIINPSVKVYSDYLQKEISDTLEKLTDKQFEKYTSIEKNLKMIYRTGFFSNVYAEIEREQNIAQISYFLESNPVLIDINLINSFSFLDSMINNFKRSNINKPANFIVYKNFHDELLGKLRNKGLSLVEITKFYFHNNSGSLEIVFSSGNIGGIEIKGNNSTNENVIAREIKANVFSIVNKNEINESIKNVMSTNLFGQVSFDYNFKKLRSDPLLNISVIEKNTKALRFTIKADNERNLQLLLDLRDENIFGTAIETGLLAAGGLRNRIYQLEIKSNQFFSLPLTFNLNSYYSFRDINTYIQVTDTLRNRFTVEKTGEYRNLRNGGLSFLFGTQLKRTGTIFAQVFFENQQIVNKANSESLVEKLRILKLKFGGLFDTEDVLPFPSNGSLINFFYETSNNLLEGNLSFSKFYFSYEQYLQVANSQTLKPKFIFGFADRTTPLTEQYSIGGDKSFFGMVEDELRGRQILEFSLEYRYLFPYKIFFDTYFSFRYDLGNVWQVTDDIRFKDLRHGIGLTTAFDTPIGEASFSAGRSFIVKNGFNNNSFVFGPYNFYFSIGYDI
ncbi:MAG: patatin-like phospholipase family protein [Ignavibacteria bacterium]|nr:patatin-like phospholipase family protein [Ignavibacteria bacterium]